MGYVSDRQFIRNVEKFRAEVERQFFFRGTAKHWLLWKIDTILLGKKDLLKKEVIEHGDKRDRA